MVMMELERPKGVSVSTALDYLEKVETELAGLYDWLATVFSEDEATKKLFRRLQF